VGRSALTPNHWLSEKHSGPEVGLEEA